MENAVGDCFILTVYKIVFFFSVSNRHFFFEYTLYAYVGACVCVYVFYDTGVCACVCVWEGPEKTGAYFIPFSISLRNKKKCVYRCLLATCHANVCL